MATTKPDYEINYIGDSEVESVHHIGLSHAGNYYSIIFGKYVNGAFCSIPNGVLDVNYPMTSRMYYGTKNHCIEY